MTTIVELLMTRDGLVDTEAQEISDDIKARVISGERLLLVLAEHGIDPRELNLQPVNLEL